MRIRSKFLALVLFVAGGFLILAFLALRTYGRLSEMRGAIDGGVRLIAQSRRAHGLMKDVVFDLFSPRVYSSLQGITLAPRSMSTRKEWSEAVAEFRTAYESFLGDPALASLLADEELRVAYNVARPMGERAFKEIADLDAAFELIRERYPGEEELYMRLQTSKDESLYSVFGRVRSASYYLGDIFESYLNRFVGGLEKSSAAAERRTLLFFSIAASVVVALAAAGSLATARSILLNIGLVDRAVERISEGDFSSRVAPLGNDELGQLAGRVNLFAARLKKNVDSLAALLADVNRELPEAPDLDRILAIVTDALLRDGGADSAAIYLREAGGRSSWSGFDPFAGPEGGAEGRPEGGPEGRPEGPAEGESAPADPWRALAEACERSGSRAPLVLRDYADDPAAFASFGLSGRARSAIAVPLVLRRAVAGYCLFERGDRPFTDLEFVHLESFADYAGQVIDNAKANAALRARADAEYRALQSQIQPHFIYNVLNGFVALSRMGEREALESSIYALKDMLRYTVEHGQGTTVAEEFAFLERYCALQRLRFDERFAYRFELEPEAAELQIPKLLVQPLLENAVIHGVEPCPRPASVLVRAEAAGGELRIAVSDDGAGGDPAAIVERPGVGIANVRERLALLYPSAWLALEGAPGKGFAARIGIPLSELGARSG